MSDLASLVVEGRDPAVVARIRGEVDISNASELGQEITAAVGNDAPGLVLDLSETRYLDSAGIRMLFDVREQLDRRGQLVCLVVPPGAQIGRMLTLTEVHQVIELFESPDAARERLARD